jgi:hypothetical protein
MLFCVAVLSILLPCVAGAQQRATPNPDTTRAKKEVSLNCFTMGYKLGLCGALSMNGHQCRPEDDVIIPVECRGKEETNIGIRVGVDSAYDKLGLPKK